MSSKPQRLDGRPRFSEDKSLIAFLAAPGQDPDDPQTRQKLVSSLRAKGLPADMVERMADDYILDLRWARDGFPTI